MHSFVFYFTFAVAQGVEEEPPAYADVVSSESAGLIDNVDQALGVDGGSPDEEERDASGPAVEEIHHANEDTAVGKLSRASFTFCVVFNLF